MTINSNDHLPFQWEISTNPRNEEKSSMSVKCFQLVFKYLSDREIALRHQCYIRPSCR